MIAAENMQKTYLSEGKPTTLLVFHTLCREKKLYQSSRFLRTVAGAVSLTRKEEVLWAQIFNTLANMNCNSA
jgi:hypothetical protein